MARDLLLLHMPLAVPVMPNLGVHLLAGCAERHGLDAAILYGTTRLRRTPVLDAFIHSVAGPAIFTPALVGRSEHGWAERMLAAPEVRSELTESVQHRARAGTGRRWPELPWGRLGLSPEALPALPDLVEPSDEALRAVVDLHVRLAGLCLDTCLADIAPATYGVYAFSVTFDAQKAASLALARLLKRRDPHIPIVFGGSACDGPMGVELVRSFPAVDVVVQGEAERRIGPLVERLLAGRPVDDLPGVCFRDGSRVVQTAAPPLLEDLDQLPVPRYDAFVEQLAASDWHAERPFILFEASRGCWWGERHHCRFCGLRGDGMRFRRKSRERLVGEVEALAAAHPQHRVLYATDAILDNRGTTAFLGALGHMRSQTPARLFFEVKSNLNAETVAAMAAAGVTTVQPGIESFSDHVLQLMDKGSSALGQVQLLKWLAAHGISVIYNLLLGTPGETVDDYRQAIELVESLHHLPPPTQVGLISLDRFSPYFASPVAYGLTRVQPEPAYSVQFPDPAVRLHQLAYRFRFDSAEQRDTELVRAWDELRAAVARWRERHPTRGLWLVDDGADLEVVECDGPTTSARRLSGVQADLYRYCSHYRPLNSVARQFPDVAAGALESCLEAWVARRWVARAGDRYLALAVPPVDRLQEGAARSRRAALVGGM